MKKGLLEEIRQQPPHVRELFMWMCVIITFSVVGFAWFKSTQKQLVALLDPQASQFRTLAEAEDQKLPSPFATLFTSFKDLKANVLELFYLGDQESDFELSNQPNLPERKPIPPQELPVSNSE